MVYDLLISCIQAAFIYSYQELVALSSPDLAQMAFQLSKRPLASRARGESAVSLGWTMNKICTNWRYRALWWRYFATNHLLELSPSSWSCFFLNGWREVSLRISFRWETQCLVAGLVAMTSSVLVKVFCLGKPRQPPILSQILILVGGFKHFLFSIIYGIILPID